MMIRFILVALSLSISVAANAAQTELGTKGGLEVETESFSFELHGRIMTDAAWFSEDAIPMNDGMEFRRARLELEGTLYEDWGYKAQYDFAENKLAAKDLYLSYAGLGSGSLLIGQFKQFFGLEELTSSKYITFMERSLPAVFNASHKIGVGYLWAGTNTTFGASVYGNAAGEGTENDGLVNFGTRFTFAPVAEKDSVLHFGLAYASEQADDTQTFSFEQRPEAHLAEKLISFDVTNANSLDKLGLEAAWVAGPFSLQGEYVDASLGRTGGLADVGFTGYYASASWFLTGESRPYKKGAFSGIKPNGKSGAWELAVRMSNLDFVDGALDGGELNDLTVGINWYANPQVRFMMNYIQAELEQAGVTDESGILQFRAQVAF